MNITEFLEARITEDEAVASAATPGPWVWAGMTNEDSLMAGESWVIAASGMHAEGYLDVSPADRAHIARHDPARILAECHAKRAIIAQHQRWPVYVESKPSEMEQVAAGLNDITYRITRQIEWLTTHEYVKRFGTEPPTAPMIATLAAVYKDHPDYQEEWTA